MFRRVTADKLRKRAQTDDQVARALLMQAAGVNCQARERRNEALVLDMEETKARIQAEVHRVGQLWRKAIDDAEAASEDADAASAVADKARADFEAAFEYEAGIHQLFIAAEAAWKAFTKKKVSEPAEIQ